VRWGNLVDVGQHAVLERKLLLDLTAGAEVQVFIRMVVYTKGISGVILSPIS
jgi:hypothetical protein